MKQFISKIVVFGLLILISILVVFCLAEGSTDAMYLKFTTPEQEALIIGSSRAAQGLHPQQLNATLQRNDIYNYAFQGPSSPYGKAYLESIKRKVSKQTINGLFILEVNPWTLAFRKKPNSQEEYLSELNGFIDNTKYVSMKPNLEYLIESYDGAYINILKDINRKGAYQTHFVEDNGWLHVTIESDMISREFRTEVKIRSYRNRLDNYKGISNYRMESLVKTIEFLKQYGQVYLVRIPVIDAMLEIENDLLPKFNEELNRIADSIDVNYINMMSDNKVYSYTDGNHLDVSSGAKFSMDLAKRIKELNTNTLD